MNTSRALIETRMHKIPLLRRNISSRRRSASRRAPSALIAGTQFVWQSEGSVTAKLWIRALRKRSRPTRRIGASVAQSLRDYGSEALRAQAANRVPGEGETTVFRRFTALNGASRQQNATTRTLIEDSVDGVAHGCQRRLSFDEKLLNSSFFPFRLGDIK